MRGEAHIIVLNSQLTRPRKWRYNTTPVTCFDWTNGCERMRIFDGRPWKSRMAYDRINNVITGSHWTDLIPSRKTVAVVGVLSCRDLVKNLALFEKSEEELNMWSKKYSIPPYKVTAKSPEEGVNTETQILTRMFVFDSSREDCNMKLSASPSLVEFPPCEDKHSHMMDSHLDIVVNNLAVSIFMQIESQIRDCNSQAKIYGGFSPHYAK